MKIDEILKEIKLACEYTGTHANDNAILESATAIFISDKNTLEEKDDNEKLREFLKKYDEFLIQNTSSQREYIARSTVVNDIKAFLNGRLKL